LKKQLAEMFNDKTFPMKLIFRNQFISAVAALFSLTAANGQQANSPTALQGRWDLTMVVDGKDQPSWLEVNHSGNHHLIGQYVGVVGSARPVSKINFNDGRFNFTIPPQWEKEDNDITVSGMLQGDSLVGTVLGADGKTNNFHGHRAPGLRRTKMPVWGTPIKLLNANSLDGWHAMGENQWEVKNGVLTSPRSGANLVTDKSFSDFKLHIEFMYPKGSNSGIYLRGRYEVQVIDSKGQEPLKDLFAGVYGFIAPTEMVAKNAGEWQTYDITLVGRMITLVANGKTVICNQEIPGITGGALNSDEGSPGPLLIQGDHGPVSYRNIVITPGK
jgi:hypothetical protein